MIMTQKFAERIAAVLEVIGRECEMKDAGMSWEAVPVAMVDLQVRGKHNIAVEKFLEAAWELEKLG